MVKLVRLLSLQDYHAQSLQYGTKYFIRVEIKINNENKEFKEEGYLPRRLAEEPPLDLITPVEKLGKS